MDDSYTKYAVVCFHLIQIRLIHTLIVLNQKYV